MLGRLISGGIAILVGIHLVELEEKELKQNKAYIIAGMFGLSIASAMITATVLIKPEGLMEIFIITAIGIISLTMEFLSKIYDSPFDMPKKILVGSTVFFLGSEHIIMGFLEKMLTA